MSTKEQIAEVLAEHVYCSCPELLDMTSAEHLADLLMPLVAEVETTREVFALGAAWALGDDDEAPAALKAKVREQAEALERVEALVEEWVEWWLMPSIDPHGGKEAAGTLIARLRTALNPEAPR